MSANAFHAPDRVWDYLARCAAARRVLPIDADLLAETVTVLSVDKPFAELTADDFDLLARAERERITAETLARLDRIDGGAP